MPVAAFTLPVNAPSDVVWRILAESADTPQRFDPTVEAVRIMDDGHGGQVREVRRAGTVRRERVEVDPAHGSLTATLVDDSAYTGSITLRAEAPNPSSQAHNHPRVSARIDWQPRSGGEDQAVAKSLTDALEDQLLRLKHAAEERAAQIEGA